MFHNCDTPQHNCDTSGNPSISIQSQYNIQFTTYHLVVVVVIATTVVDSWLLQAGQQSGISLGVVLHNSGNATKASTNASTCELAIPASCDNDDVTVGHLDTTNNPGMIYQLVSVLLSAQQICIS